MWRTRILGLMGALIAYLSSGAVMAADKPEYSGLLGDYSKMHGIIVATLALVTASVLSASAQDQAELAKKLQNPVANLISVPLQSNWDFGIGPADAPMPTSRTLVPIGVSVSRGCISNFWQKRATWGRSSVKFRGESEENYGAREESPAGGSEGHL